MQGAFGSQTNQIAYYRNWEITFGGMMGNDPSGVDVIQLSSTSNRDRWIGRCHTGPFTKQLAVRMLVCQTNFGVGGGSSTTPPGGQLTVLTTGGSIIGTASFTFGITNQTALNVPSNYGWGTGYITVPANSDFLLKFTEISGGRLVSATVWEVPLDPDTANGYVQSNYAAQQAIYDTDRSGVQTALYNLWKHSGFPCFNWSVDFQIAPQVTNSLIARNLIDNSSTTIDPTTPGFTVDLTNCARLSQATSGVPAILYVYGQWGGASGTGGNVRLNGSTPFPVTVSGFNTTGQWLSVATTLPASLTKYDLQFWSSTAGTNFNVMAATLLLYEA